MNLGEGCSTAQRVYSLAPRPQLVDNLTILHAFRLLARVFVVGSFAVVLLVLGSLLHGYLARAWVSELRHTIKRDHTEAFHGRLGEAREFSRRAIELAQHAGNRETAALWQMNGALREAEFGNWQVALRGAAAALAFASTRDVQILAALILAQSGDAAQAQKMSNDLARRYPVDTLINRYWLPTIRAAIELDRNNAAEAIKLLQGATSYELGSVLFTAESAAPLHPVYVRGEAYLRLHRGKEAAAEYRKFVDHWGAVKNTPLGALARLGLARAYAMQADSAKAHTAYQDFFTLWKDADPDIPILKQAKTEYAKLQ